MPSQQPDLSVGIHIDSVKSNEACFKEVANQTYVFNPRVKNYVLAENTVTFNLEKVLLVVQALGRKFESTHFVAANSYGRTGGRGLVDLAETGIVDFAIRTTKKLACAESKHEFQQSSISMTEERFAFVSFSAVAEFGPGYCFLICDPLHFFHVDPLGLMKRILLNKHLILFMAISSMMTGVLNLGVEWKADKFPIKKLLTSIFFDMIGWEHPRNRLAYLTKSCVYCPMLSYVFLQGVISSKLIDEFIIRRKFPLRNPNDLVRAIGRNEMELSAYTPTDTTFTLLKTVPSYRPIFEIIKKRRIKFYDYNKIGNVLGQKSPRIVYHSDAGPAANLMWKNKHNLDCEPFSSVRLEGIF